MRICVTSEGDNLEAKVDSRFGRCRYFIMTDPDTLEFEAISNPNIESMGGVGIQSAQLVSSKEAKAVLTGNVGPNAFQTLQAAGIEVFTNISGTVREAIEKFKKGEFKAVSGPSVSSHAGMPSRKNNSG
ncbi:MAG: NifB/NifX family molybdenum-iron cluster-binding protein [Candidatus Omnitrophica bacterium]|nr:NifB/NifX family molybdenum-iron cluster-binding protein [Candidatus Omnitrophota bacterium]MDD5771668.1 NifB/NifX family molybdenum-iron cluster-binding protein [Candidatus Omnitrophota bacterium]